MYLCSGFVAYVEINCQWLLTCVRRCFEYSHVPLRAPCVQETVHAALFSATAALPRVCSAMSLYLDNKATEGILLHPVQRRVVDAVDVVRDLLQRLHPAEVSVRLLVDAAKLAEL